MSLLTLLIIFGSPFFGKYVAENFGDRFLQKREQQNKQKFYEIVDNFLLICSGKKYEWFRSKIGFVFGLGISTGICLEKILNT